MYTIPKIKKFSTITHQSQKSWRSNLSSNSKRHFILHDITQNLLLIKDDLTSFFENNKEYLFPTDNEEYICLDNSSSVVPPEELLYRLIDILKNDDFITRLEEASSTINSLSKQLDDAKIEIESLKKKKRPETDPSSFRSDYASAISKELINKIKEKNLINQRLSKDYDCLIDEYIAGLNQRLSYEHKIKNLEENLKDYKVTKIKNEELSESNKQMKDEMFLKKNEIDELKKINNKFYEENIKIKDEVQRLYKLVEFKNKEYLDLTDKNKELLKDNYICGMKLKTSEEKLKLNSNNLKQEKEKNKEIIDDLEKQISEKENEINDMRKKLKKNVAKVLEENKKGNFEFVLDEVNNKLKIIYKGQIICNIPKFNREFAASFFSRKKYKISSNIHPTLSFNNENKINSYRPMTLSKKKKVCEINNFNITYKLSKNEYEFDSGSSLNHSSNSISHSSFRLDKLYEQISDSFKSKSRSKSKSKRKSESKKLINNENANYKKCLSQKFEKSLISNNKKSKKPTIRRAMTDVKGRMFLKNNLLKINSFGFDVESIKEEKDEDNISISNFDFNIKPSNEKEISLNHNKIKDISSISEFIETNSPCPAYHNKNGCNMLVINHVDDFYFNRKYLYPNNVKLKVKKVNVQRIVHTNREKETPVIIDGDEGCKIF